MANLMNILPDVVIDPVYEVTNGAVSIFVILVIAIIVSMIVIPGIVLAIVFGTRAKRNKVAETMVETVNKTGKTE